MKVNADPTTINSTYFDFARLGQYRNLLVKAIACGVVINEECTSYEVSCDCSTSPITKENYATSVASPQIVASKSSSASSTKKWGQENDGWGTSSSLIHGTDYPLESLYQKSVTKNPTVSLDKEMVETKADIKDKSKYVVKSELNVHCGISIGSMAGVDLIEGGRGEYFLVGDAVRDVTEAESYAKIGELVISPSKLLPIIQS